MDLLSSEISKAITNHRKSQLFKVWTLQPLRATEHFISTRIFHVVVSQLQPPPSETKGLMVIIKNTTRGALKGEDGVREEVDRILKK